MSENAEYHSAKEQQGWIEARVTELEDKISRAELIDVTKLSGDTVMFGAKVTLVDEESEDEASYQIVGEFEADVKKGKISVTSPIARAIIGKKQGDSVEVNTPGGGKSYEILKVKWPEAYFSFDRNPAKRIKPSGHGPWPEATLMCPASPASANCEPQASAMSADCSSVA